jgi:DNA topoisomerase-3
MSETIACPACGKALQKKKGSKGDFWGCTGYPNCTFTLSDLNGQSLTLKCPECGEFLRAGENSHGAYIACFSKENHVEGKALFFDLEGKVREKGEGERQKAKGSFSCPECGQELKYFRQKTGKSAGQMCFACFNSEAHAEGKAHFYPDNGGAPKLQP